MVLTFLVRSLFLIADKTSFDLFFFKSDYRHGAKQEGEVEVNEINKTKQNKKKEN